MLLWCFYLVNCILKLIALIMEKSMNILKEIQESNKIIEGEIEEMKKKSDEFRNFMRQTIGKQEEEEVHRRKLEEKISSLTSEIERLKKAEKSKVITLHNFIYYSKSNLGIFSTVTNLFKTLIKGFDVNSVNEVFLLGKRDIKSVLIKFNTQYAKK